MSVVVRPPVERSRCDGSHSVDDHIWVYEQRDGLGATLWVYSYSEHDPASTGPPLPPGWYGAPTHPSSTSAYLCADCGVGFVRGTSVGVFGALRRERWGERRMRRKAARVSV